ncbi:ERF family protein [Candidatus Venteria ishoeyi]
MKELVKIQAELKAPKNQRNNFGKYNYRSCEDILEGLKTSFTI